MLPEYAQCVTLRPVCFRLKYALGKDYVWLLFLNCSLFLFIGLFSALLNIAWVQGENHIILELSFFNIIIVITVKTQQRHENRYLTIWPFTIHSSQVFATSRAGRASTLMEVSNLFREVTELCAQKDGTDWRTEGRLGSV